MAGKKEVKKKRKPQGGKTGKVIAAFLLYFTMAVMGYALFTAPPQGTPMAYVRSALCGLGGKVAIAIPLMLGWAGTLCALKAAGRKIPAWKAMLDGVLWLCLFTVAHLFVTETVMRERMQLQTFANFVCKSYASGLGGGAIGALLAWPAYKNLGGLGSGIAAALVVAVELLLTGRLPRFIDWMLENLADAKDEAYQRRMEKKSRDMFKFEESAPESKKKRAKAKREDSLNGEETLLDDDPQPVHAFRDDPDSPAARRRKSNSKLQRDVQSLLDEAERRRSRAAQPELEVNLEMFSEHSKPKRKAAKVNVEMPDTPEKPAAKRRPRPVKTVEEGVRALSVDDDLSIEPENIDFPDDDECPFEVTEKVEKKPLKKMKRPAPKPEAEEESTYNYPPIDLLEMSSGVTENHRAADMEKAQLLEETLKQFGIATKLTGIAHGPAVTRFELQPAPGIKVSRIAALQDDIAMHLAAMSVRIEAPIPGKAAVGVEIPNEKIEMVRLRDILESAEAKKLTSRIAVGLGKDNAGRYIVTDIAKMPHVLIAGQTGSGKSVCINSIITSILYRATPEEVKLILIDPKMVELSVYNDIPHLVCPVVTDCKKAAGALEWAVAEMTERYKKFGKCGVRNIQGYNQQLKPGEPIMPQMVIVIDELADLMMVAPGEVEDSICRLAQLARAAGMHLVIATQRPSVNVITGIIKANIPTRIAFSVASQVDSRTMIDHGGAEKLLGNGDMLFVPNGINKPIRVQGAWVSDEEVHAIVDYIKERSETAYDEDMIETMENAVRSDAQKEEFNEEYDPKLPEAVEIVVEAGQASVSMLQRRMRVGYARAGRLIDEMEQRGIVSEADGAKPRTVLITREEMNAMFFDPEN